MRIIKHLTVGAALALVGSASYAMPFHPDGVYDLAATPQKAATITNVVRDNGRPMMHFGIAKNGVIFAPAPATPFIFENPNTGVICEVYAKCQSIGRGGCRSRN